MMTMITQLRSKAQTYVVGLLWAHVALFAGMALLLADGSWSVAAAAAALAGLTTIMWKAQTESAALRFTATAALVSQPMLLVFALGGHEFQIDGHMYFFAILAICTIFFYWPSVLFGAALIAVHHLLLNFALPAALFPNGTDFLRVVFHAVIVVAETGVLMLVCLRFEQTLIQSQKALSDAQVAQAAASAAQEENETFSARSKQERQQALEAISKELQNSVAAVVKTLKAEAEASRRSGDVLGGLSTRGAQSAGQLGQEATAAEATSREVATAASTMSGAIDQMASRVEEGASITQSAVQEVERTNATVEELASAAQKIGAIVQLINEIASQTNLLALNATIEAARAGEAGKGFAVVASEVKNLASQTAKATEEISSHINSIQQTASLSVNAIRGIGEVIRRINGVTVAIAEDVRTQSGTTGIISRNMQSISQTSVALATGIQGLGQISGEVNDVSRQLQGSATALAQQTEKLGHVVEDLAVRIAKG